MGRTPQRKGTRQVKRPPFAFPDTQPLNEYAEHGMTLRDYFAGQALAGRLADGTDRLRQSVAEEAYAYADAMIEARDA
jgi:hypothetical protein